MTDGQFPPQRTLKPTCFYYRKNIFCMHTSTFILNVELFCKRQNKVCSIFVSVSLGNILSETKLIYWRPLNKTLVEERCSQIELRRDDSFCFFPIVINDCRAIVSFYGNILDSCLNDVQYDVDNGNNDVM